MALTVRFGRIGATGQTKVKTLASEAVAQAEAARLILEKTGKGYVEIGGVIPVSVPSAVGQTPGGIEVESVGLGHEIAEGTNGATVEPARPAASPAVSETIDGGVWPEGGFAWTDELRAQLPVMRGVRVEPFEPSLVGVSMPPSFDLDSNLRELVVRNWHEMTSAGADCFGELWEASEASEYLQARCLLERDPAAWRQIYFQCAALGRFAVGHDLLWAVDVAIGLHGLAFALERTLECAPAVIRQRFGRWSMDPHASQRLRIALAAADEATHAACVAIAATHRGGANVCDVLVSYLFPERRDWAEECVARGAGEQLGWWLGDCALSVASAEKLFGDGQLYACNLISAALLHIELHGDGALHLLVRFLDRATSKDDMQAMLRLLERMHTPALIPALVARAERLDVRNLLERLADRWPAAVFGCAVKQACGARSRALEGWAVRLAMRLPDAVAPGLMLCPEGARVRFGELLDSLAAPLEAPESVLPAILRAPPWATATVRMPELPAFFLPAAMRRPTLRGGGALSLVATTHLGVLLSMSTLQVPHGGLAEVRAVCAPESLAEFAWDLFESWLSVGAPKKESWAFAALGLLGNDETARRLAPRIREWPAEAAHARAAVGLDILAAIGTDVALMHLSGIAGKVKYKGLKDKASARIAELAELRGLPPEELADRLVPDLGLDRDGTLELDFGPRRFRLGFNEMLKPFVRDAAGARLKDLPKPNRGDEAVLAAAAVERYRSIKKDAREIAGLQVARCEQAMCRKRRWNAGAFRACFIEHPLMRHLARRVVWGVYREQLFMDGFRVAEDLTLTDRHDDSFVLPPDAEVGIAHVLDMPVELVADFERVFADYEIVQPFRQIGREIYLLTDEERRDGQVTRFKDKRVATGSVLGLVGRGWERGEVQDAGWMSCFLKRLPGDLVAELSIDPGTIAGDAMWEPEQTLPRLRVRRQGSEDDNGVVPLTALDPVWVSELIRDIDLLAGL